MAKSISINGVVYPDVPYINAPLSTGNGNATFYDTSDANADASKILQGYSGYNGSGKVQGSLTVISVSQDQTTKVLTIS